MSVRSLTVDFAGDVRTVEVGATLTVGRNGDLAIEDNPYLHRSLLHFAHVGGFWWLANVGSRIAVHISDAARLSVTTLAPDARLPLVFPCNLATFQAGDTSYELLVDQDIPDVDIKPSRMTPGGNTTLGAPDFTESQLLAVLALAEPLLRYSGQGASGVRSAVETAARLGWTQTRFNRKLDNVCDKLDRAGVRGLRGGPGTQAANRRVRLVEYALGSRLITSDDLALLQAEVTRNRPSVAEGARS